MPERCSEKKSLLGLTLPQLQEVVTGLGLPKFTATQIAGWLYQKRATSIDEMTNISLKGREALSKEYVTGRKKPVKASRSKDGTVKYLFEIEDNKFVESVYIPEEDRATLCISSQIGCQMNCEFCATGKQGFKGNLTSGQILNQIFETEKFDTLTNIVYMGMGEPLNNTDEVLRSIEIITANYGLAWSPKRITLSTVGILPGLERFLQESKCNLAISLHFPYSEVRAAYMPAEKAYPLSDVLSLVKQYDWSGQRRISFEYTMFDGVNDSISDADHLAKMIKGIPCRVNLIPYHSIPDVKVLPSKAETMTEFMRRLEKYNITTTIRRSRGQDIEAACGMLSKIKALL
ncbi:MAG: 23S rRNA (adenine(2503)-C(2))-methyltransferase RlmN [Paludibacteraceae bacterium]|nr:23S rRNA (adenine(2503)-C(2))-methyltransferase RlmN [Paludibacteraceae bacterium]